MKELAEELSAKSEGRIVLGLVSLNRFPDSFPNIFIKNAELLRWADAAFLASFHEPGVIFEQISFVWMLPQHSVRSLKILLPFFPTGTMERVVSFGEVATAKTLARLISATPLTQRGPPHVLMLDLHTLQNQFYFDDSVIPVLHTATGLLLQEMHAREDRDNISICFPDDGAHKRFGKFFPGFPQVICAKVRVDPVPVSPTLPVSVTAGMISLSTAHSRAQSRAHSRSHSFSVPAPAGDANDAAADGSGGDASMLTVPTLIGLAASSPPLVAMTPNANNGGANVVPALSALSLSPAAPPAPAAVKKIVTVKDGNCAGRHVIIIDDLIHSGGTMLECVKACHAAGATKISAFCTHAVFENEAWRRFTEPFDDDVDQGRERQSDTPVRAKEKVKTGAELLDTFWITNSHPMSKLLAQKRPFKVLSIAPLLQDALLD